MKLTWAFILFLNLQMSASVWSQTMTMSVNLKNSTLQELFTQIEKSSDYRFFYNNDEVDVNQRISVNAEEKTVEVILATALKGLPYTFKESENKLIVIERIGGTPDPSGTNVQQRKTVTGKVTDILGVGLPGVSVVVKGTTIGITTNNNGNFSLVLPNDAKILTFSFVGMRTQEIMIGDKMKFSVALLEETIGMEEVVAIGYGSQKKGVLTSAVSVVKMEEISKAPVGNLTNALGGRASGIISRSNSGEPGSDAPTILVRGVSTTGNSQALYVVDGVVDRDISNISPLDIESVTVLKDASAVAPFGARGANGVILVTTRRGKIGKPTINYSFYQGIQKPIMLPRFASSSDYAEMMNEAYQNVGQPEPFTAQDIEKYKAGNTPEFPNTNWYDEILRKNPLQSQHNLTVSGGAEKIKYFVSLGKFGQEGYWANTDYNRYNIRSNIDAEITKDLKISFDLAGSTSKRDNPIGGQYTFMGAPQRNPSINPVRNSNGQFVDAAGGNPVAELELGGYNRNMTSTFSGTVSFEYNVPFVPGLSFTGKASYDKYLNDQKTFDKSFSVWKLIDRQNATYQEIPAVAGPGLFLQNDQSQTTLTEGRINYSKIINDHTIKALFVYTRQDWNSNWLSGNRSNFISASVDQLFAGPQLNQIANGSAYDGSRSGMVGRLTYDYKSKYLFEANFRRDGSMNFPKEGRFGFFPSLALGWRISEESFFKSIKSVDNLKIRGSYGKAGNDRIDPYLFLGTYGFSSIPYTFGGNPMLTTYEARLPNPAATWETATMTDIGLEGSMWQRKLTFEADYFYKKTEDILRPTGAKSSIIGISLPPQNIGIVENQGIELLLGHASQIGDFKYDVQFNYTYAKNKALELGEASGTLNDPIRRRTGRPLNQYFGYLSDGLFTSAEEIANSPVTGAGVMPGDIKYKDINGPDGIPDGVITALDETAIGFSNIPEIVYGFNIDLKYKRFDMSIFFQGAAHMSYWFRSYVANAFDNGGSIQNWQIEERYRVDAPDANAKYPRLSPSPIPNNYLYTSDYWLRDGTYLRLKTAQVGYTFNSNWLLSKTGMKNLRIYVSGQNLFTYVKDKLNFVDVEAGDNAGQFYPQPKVYTAGLSVSF